MIQYFSLKIPTKTYKNINIAISVKIIQPITGKTTQNRMQNINTKAMNGQNKNPVNIIA